MIHHLVPATVWDGLADGHRYAPATIVLEGFVHCTGDEETLLQVANAFYRDLPGEVLVLDLDEARVGSEVRWEQPVPAPPPGAGFRLYPHVYGPIDRGAVVGVRRLVRALDGTYLGYEERA